jgi:hypothetical protein
MWLSLELMEMVDVAVIAVAYCLLSVQVCEFDWK